jgi:hypothetical protein
VAALTQPGGLFRAKTEMVTIEKRLAELESRRGPLPLPSPPSHHTLARSPRTRLYSRASVGAAPRASELFSGGVRTSLPFPLRPPLLRPHPHHYSRPPLPIT